MKTYLKPVLYYERFELSQHIASCDMRVNNVLGTGCTASGVMGFIPIENGFLSSDIYCTVKAASGEIYCYTNGAEITVLHAS